MSSLYCILCVREEIRIDESSLRNAVQVRIQEYIFHERVG